MQPENQCSLLCQREKSRKVPQGSADTTGNLSQVLLSQVLPKTLHGSGLYLPARQPHQGRFAKFCKAHFDKIIPYALN